MYTSRLQTCGTQYQADFVFVQLQLVPVHVDGSGSFYDGTASACVMDEINSSSDGYGTHFHLLQPSYWTIGSPTNFFVSIDAASGSGVETAVPRYQVPGTMLSPAGYHLLGMICKHGTSPLSCRFLNLEAYTVIHFSKETMAHACSGDDTDGHPICTGFLSSVVYENF